MARFYIPHLRDDPAVAETEWERYLGESPAPPDSRRVYSLTYERDGDRYEVTVGQARKCYRRRTGPRGGYIKNADHERVGRRTGTMVSGIIDAGELLYVWSYGPPFGGWHNPSLVGRGEVRMIQYFDEPDDRPEADAE